MEKLIRILSILLLFPVQLFGQWENPVQFEVSEERLSPTEVTLVFKGKLDAGWHVYGSDMAEGGPTVASFHLDRAKGIETVGKLISVGVKEKYDEMFSMKVRYMEGIAEFRQKLKIISEEYSAEGYLEFGACNDQNCLPPTEVPFSVKGNNGPKTLEEDITSTQQIEESGDTLKNATVLSTDTLSRLSGGLPAYWKPVTDDLADNENSTKDSSVWIIFLLGMLGGLLAVVTPCVWPIIPMTISFFLKRAESRIHGLRDALLYGLSIIVIYVTLGVLITLISGSNGLNELSTSAIFNLICFVVLVVFAASFLGGFEILLPSSWGNKTDSQADAKGGLIGIFLMAITLTLVSFSCTGPIIGFLLVDLTTSSNYLAPVVGLFGFALALALPFTLFALFPSLIKKAPKSGGWMNKVKVTLGFVELAFALKFFSVADMAYGWHLLDRETFLAIWITLFLLLGIYLLGKLRFPADSPSDHTSIPGFFCGLVSIAFAIYMLPGLWGAPLKAISAFAPPMSTQDFNLNKGDEVKAQFSNYDEAVDYARQNNKPLLLDFTGFGCVNCRKMEAAVWNNPQVSERLNNDFVLVSLYVDDRTPLDSVLIVNVDGKSHKLKTRGQLWSFLQSYKFGANTQPFYVPVNANGDLLNQPCSYNESVADYVNFLQKSIESFTRTRNNQ